mmetsp:Transcript_11872/g.13690  ORF Transcript_11872/g.13690 Transcript_11872/m.13690 type:complete len:314 (-) Transcript_11872:25-966(-)
MKKNVRRKESKLRGPVLKPEFFALWKDKDAWFEIPLGNDYLFDSLQLQGLEPLLPGRLFSTRIPRKLYTKPGMAKKFEKKVKKYKLDTVVILTEHKEYEKYAEVDIEGFYKRLGLDYICSPIADFGVPAVEELTYMVTEVTKALAEGKNVLVHCAGGNGRTGMLLAGIVKNAGVDKPIEWVRRVKTTYVETEGQKKLVESMPLTLDKDLANQYPVLARAIIMDRVLDSISEKKRTGRVVLSEAQKAEQKLAFDQLDLNGDGQITVEEFLEVLGSLGDPWKRKVSVEILKKIDKDGDEKVDYDEFLQAISVTTI